MSELICAPERYREGKRVKNYEVNKKKCGQIDRDKRYDTKVKKRQACLGEKDANCFIINKKQLELYQSPWVNSVTYLGCNLDKRPKEERRKQVMENPPKWKWNPSSSELQRKLPNIISVKASPLAKSRNFTLSNITKYAYLTQFQISNIAGDCVAYRIEYLPSNVNLAFTGQFRASQNIVNRFSKKREKAIAQTHHVTVPISGRTRNHQQSTVHHEQSTVHTQSIANHITPITSGTHHRLHQKMHEQAQPVRVNARSVISNNQMDSHMHRRRLKLSNVPSNTKKNTPYNSVGWIYFNWVDPKTYPERYFDPEEGIWASGTIVGSIEHESWGNVYVLAAAHDILSEDYPKGGGIKILEMSHFCFLPAFKNEEAIAAMFYKEAKGPRNILRKLVQVWVLDSYKTGEVWVDIALYKFEVNFAEVSKRYDVEYNKDEFIKDFPEATMKASDNVPFTRDLSTYRKDRKTFSANMIVPTRGYETNLDLASKIKDGPMEFTLKEQPIEIVSNIEGHYMVWPKSKEKIAMDAVRASVLGYHNVPFMFGFCGSIIVPKDKDHIIGVSAQFTSINPKTYKYDPKICEESEINQMKDPPYEGCTGYAARLTPERLNAIFDVMEADATKNQEIVPNSDIEDSDEDKWRMIEEKWKLLEDWAKDHVLISYDKYVIDPNSGNDLGLEFAEQGVDNLFDDYNMDYYQYVDYSYDYDYYQNDDEDVLKIGHNVTLAIMLMDITVLVILCACIYMVIAAIIGYCGVKLGKKVKKAMDDQHKHEYKSESEIVDILDNHVTDEDLN